jgi:hypothetical protein
LEYPKTENLWKRDPDTNAMAPENGVRVEEVGWSIAGSCWRRSTA